METLCKTCVPEMKLSVPDPYDWQERHRLIIEANRKRNPRLVLVGDSIIHYWGGVPAHEIQRGPDSWNATFEPYRAVNMGFGMDRVENMLWRVMNGELDNIAPEVVILEGGTNNYGSATDDEIAVGMRHLAEEDATRQPQAKLLLHGMTPSAKSDHRALALTARYAALDGLFDGRLRFLDIGPALRGPDGKIDNSLFVDGCHPNAEGNRRLAERIGPELARCAQPDADNR
jgi:hypothetical protein